MTTKYRVTLILNDGRKLFYGTFNQIPDRASIPIAYRDLQTEVFDA